MYGGRMKRPLLEKIDYKDTLDEQRLRYYDRWLVLLFSILWISDGGITLWATNNGYVEWNQWTMAIGHTWVFILVKLLTLVLVIGIVRWASKIFPYVISIALIIFNIMMVTVTAANIITIAK